MKVLAAVDRSGMSDVVIDMVRYFLAGKSGSVLLINVAPRESDLLCKQLRRKVITDPVPKELRDRRELLDRHAATLQDAEIPCETLLIRGEPVRTILREAKRWEANLIAVGSHGRGALYRRILGSVSEGVLKGQQFPVLIVPAQIQTETV